VNLLLQTLTPDHLDQVVALDALCFGKLWSRDLYVRELDSDRSDLIAVIQNNQLLAYACVWCILEEAHITILAVDPTYQRLGLGRLLLWGLMECAIARGLERSTLEVKPSNIGAIALYQSYGFSEAGRRPKYYDDGSAALILWRSQLQYPEFKVLQQQQEQNIHQQLQRYGWDLMVSLDTDKTPVTPLT
jgi:[ribosomal protein S18]-alanine N-acetyltransferase